MATRWDARVASQALALGALLFVVGCLLTAATDEGGVAWATRVARTLPALPACGGAAALLVLRRAEGRGELRALATLGASPARAAAFVVAAAASLSALGAVTLVAWAPAAESFFPRAPAGSSIRYEGGAFVDDERGVRVTQAGEMSVVSSAHAGAPASAAHALPAAAVVLAFGLALALGAPRTDARAILAALGAAGACVLLLQAAAAGKTTPWLACLPAMLLLLGASVRYRSLA